MKFKKGDWVMFRDLPTWVSELPTQSRRVFRFCLGKQYRITEITPEGLLVLDVSEDVDKKFGGKFNDIRIEPQYVERARSRNHEAGSMKRKGPQTGMPAVILEDLSDEQAKALLPPNIVLLGYRGSLAHGMYVPSSSPNSIDDKDLLGVCIGPPSSYFGLDLGRFGQHEAFIGAWDSVVYEIRKYVRLCTKANPNTLSLLWLRPDEYLYRTPIGEELIGMRDLFMSKRLHESFSGYAANQLKRMTHLAFKGYMGEKRKKLVDKFGYDTKNAAHAIRLLRMGIEALRDGSLNVRRTKDASELLEIKRGVWTLEAVNKEAEKLSKQAQSASEKCKLPDEPDYQEIDRRLTRIVREYWEGHRNEGGAP